jgi:hypothetical protein
MDDRSAGRRCRERDEVSRGLRDRPLLVVREGTPLGSAAVGGTEKKDARHV